ncbi:MAG TPA: DNA glycosylase [Verrucomicrobiae bacterium]|nr:DNA glycosylase [Verrucomicrobiae bacterium]
MPDLINVFDFDLTATLECGQAFRWSRCGENGWHEGVVGKAVWRLRQTSDSVVEAVVPGGCGKKTLPPGTATATLMSRYLSLDRSLPQIVATFPADDQALHAAVRRHWGLRVLRQEPWECLASFIASSTKQIVQIRQIVELLARRFGEPIAPADARAGGSRRAQDWPLGKGTEWYHTFPTIEAIARATHDQLWNCKLGFRAKNLLAAARTIDSGKIDWAKITDGQNGQDARSPMDYETALAELMKLPGVGEKIANCTLLFACGFDEAFPVDVWIERALRRIYFAGKKKVTARQLREFARSHFGPYAGWAQQYLFFNERLLRKHRPRRGQTLLDVGTQ